MKERRGGGRRGSLLEDYVLCLWVGSVIISVGAGEGTLARSWDHWRSYFTNYWRGERP